MSQHIIALRRRRTPIAIIGVLALLAGILVLGGTANAVHDTGAFELDGNAVTDNTPPGADDWDRVCFDKTTSATVCGTNTGSSAVASSWTSEPNLNSSIFTGGGSKDPIDVSSWAWKDGAGGLPDKDNLLHSFAARYSLPNTQNGSDLGHCPAGTTATTCEVLYFGSDRYDNSGDAQQGFWFFQNTVTLDSNKVGGGSGFKGVHKAGDVLVISDFSNGGSTASITVYKWDPTCTKAGGPCGDVNLRTLENSDTANCSNAGDHDQFCAIVNPSNGTTAPWAFTDKSGNHSYLQGEFFEGGINLSTLGLGDECFSSVMSETRSSQSTTAVLKDFVLGSFANCNATLATQVSATSVNPGQQVTDTATVTGNSPTHTPTGNITTFMCSFASGSTDACDDSDASHHGTTVTVGTLSGTTATATTVTDPVNTAGSPLSPGRYCFRAEWPGDSNYTVDPSPLKEYSAATECFSVVQSGTTTVTDPRLAGTTATVTTVNFGASVVDHAVITGASGFGTPTGSVNFFICNPTQTSGTAGNEVCPTTTGTAVGTTVPVSAVAGSDPPQSEATSTATVANQLGLWCFRATYTPNTSNYTGSGDGNHNECFRVTDSTDYTSAQKWLPNDSVTISSAHGAPVSGSLVIKLFKGSTCGIGSPVYTETTITVSAAGTFNTTNGSNNATKYEVDASKADTFWWDVQFTSSNSNLSGFHTCTETSSVSITN